MADKVKKKSKIDLYRYVMIAVLVFLAFCGFDMIDGDPNGLRGLAEFVRLIVGSDV